MYLISLKSPPLLLSACHMLAVTEESQRLWAADGKAEKALPLPLTCGLELTVKGLGRNGEKESLEEKREQYFKKKSNSINNWKYSAECSCFPAKITQR